MTCVKNKLKDTNNRGEVGLRNNEILEFWQPNIFYGISPLAECGVAGYTSLYNTLITNRDVNNAGGCKGFTRYANINCYIDIAGGTSNDGPKILSGSNPTMTDPFLTEDQLDECEQSDEGCPTISAVCNIGSLEARTIYIYNSICSISVIKNELNTHINNSVLKNSNIDSKILFSLEKTQLINSTINTAVFVTNPFVWMSDCIINCSKYVKIESQNFIIKTEPKPGGGTEYEFSYTDDNGDPVLGFAITNCVIESPLMTILDSSISGCDLNCPSVYIKNSILDDCLLELSSSVSEKADELNDWIRNYAKPVKLDIPDDLQIPPGETYAAGYIPVPDSTSVFNTYTCNTNIPFIYDPETGDAIGCTLKLQNTPSTFRTQMAQLLNRTFVNSAGNTTPIINTYNAGVSQDISIEYSTFYNLSLTSNDIHINNCTFDNCDINCKDINLESLTLDNNTTLTCNDIKPKFPVDAILTNNATSNIISDSININISFTNNGTTTLSNQIRIPRNFVNNGVLNIENPVVVLETAAGGIYNFILARPKGTMNGTLNGENMVGNFVNIGTINLSENIIGNITNNGSINASAINGNVDNSAVISLAYYDGFLSNRGSFIVDTIISGTITQNTASIKASSIDVRNSNIEGIIEASDIKVYDTTISSVITCSNLELNGSVLGARGGSVSAGSTILFNSSENYLNLMEHTSTFIHSKNYGNVINAVFKDRSVHNGFAANSEFYNSEICGTLSGNIIAQNCSSAHYCLGIGLAEADVELTECEFQTRFSDLVYSYTFIISSYNPETEQTEQASLTAKGTSPDEALSKLELPGIYNIIETSSSPLSSISLTDTRIIGGVSASTININQNSVIQGGFSLQDAEEIVANNISLNGPNSSIANAIIYIPLKVPETCSISNCNINDVQVQGSSSNCIINKGTYSGQGKLIWTISDSENNILGNIEGYYKNDTAALEASRTLISNGRPYRASLRFSDIRSTITYGQFDNLNMQGGLIIGSVDHETNINNCYFGHSIGSYSIAATFNFNDCILEIPVCGTEVRDRRLGPYININNSTIMSIDELKQCRHIVLTNTDNYSSFNNFYVNTLNFVSSTNFGIINCVVSDIIFTNSTNNNYIRTYSCIFNNSVNNYQISVQLFTTNNFDGFRDIVYEIVDNPNEIYIYKVSSWGTGPTGFHFDGYSLRYFNGSVYINSDDPLYWLNETSFIYQQIIFPGPSQPKIIADTYIFKR